MNEATKLKEEEIEEVSPLDLISSLERDCAIQQAALRKIMKMNPAQFRGGPSNQKYGRRHEQAFDECRSIAHDAVHRVEKYTK